MRLNVVLLTVLGLCPAIACAKKPTVQECQRAVDHVFELLDKEAAEQFKERSERAGAPTSFDPSKAMADVAKNMRGTETWAIVRAAHIRACQHQPETRATCVSNAKSVDELVTACGMKSSPSPGGKKVEWPG